MSPWVSGPAAVGKGRPALSPGGTPSPMSPTTPQESSWASTHSGKYPTSYAPATLFGRVDTALLLVDAEMQGSPLGRPKFVLYSGTAVPAVGPINLLLKSLIDARL